MLGNAFCTKPFNQGGITKNSDSCRRVSVGLPEDNVLNGRSASRLLIIVQMLQAFCHDRQKALYYMNASRLMGSIKARLFFSKSIFAFPT
jgi:hypothetical protein